MDRREFSTASVFAALFGGIWNIKSSLPATRESVVPEKTYRGYFITEDDFMVEGKVEKLRFENDVGLFGRPKHYFIVSHPETVMPDKIVKGVTVVNEDFLACSYEMSDRHMRKRGYMLTGDITALIWKTHHCSALWIRYMPTNPSGPQEEIQ